MARLSPLNGVVAGATPVGYEKWDNKKKGQLLNRIFGNILYVHSQSPESRAITAKTPYSLLPAFEKKTCHPLRDFSHRESVRNNEKNNSPLVLGH